MALAGARLAACIAIAMVLPILVEASLWHCLSRSSSPPYSNQTLMVNARKHRSSGRWQLVPAEHDHTNSPLLEASAGRLSDGSSVTACKAGNCQGRGEFAWHRAAQTLSPASVSAEEQQSQSDDEENDHSETAGVKMHSMARTTSAEEDTFPSLRSLLREGGDNVEGQEVRVSNGSQLFEVLNSTNVSSAPSFTIHIMQDLAFDGLPGFLNFPPNANVTLRGHCGDRRCLIDGVGDRPGDERSFVGPHPPSPWGSVSLYDLEFRSLSFFFVDLRLVARNCVFRKCGCLRMEYNVVQEKDTSAPPRLSIDGCFFVENDDGVILFGIPRRACISRSEFVASVQDRFALQVTFRPTAYPRWLSIRDCTFGQAERGSALLSFITPASAQGGGGGEGGGEGGGGGEGRGEGGAPSPPPEIDVVDGRPAKSTVSFVNCTFNKGNVIGPVVAIFVQPEATSTEEPPSVAALGVNTSGEPIHHVQFCGGSFTGQRHAASTSGDQPPDYDVNATWITGASRLALQQCSITDSEHGFPNPKAKIAVNGPQYFIIDVDNNSTELNGSSCGSCSDVSTGCNATGPIFPLDRVPLQPSPGETGTRLLLPLAIGIPLGVLVVAMIGAFGAWGWPRRSWSCSFKRKKETVRLPGDVQDLRCFTLSELEHATNNFTSVIGEGGSGVVYKGMLETGEVAAVKSLNQGRWRSEREFLHEVAILGRVAHKNLVTLLGFCKEPGRYLLVYEFVPNRTLGDHLHGCRADCHAAVLDWATRVRIAQEVGMAIEFLHHLLNPPVVHRDIKPENVLLLADFTPKVADFGLCRKIHPQGDSFRTLPAGTVGYTAPEVFRGKGVTEKVDVYSYGVLLLEMITGRRPLEDDKSLVYQVTSAVKDKESARGLADSKLQGQFDVDQLYLLTTLATSCVSQRADRRPSMLQAVRVLKRINQSDADLAPGSADEVWRANQDSSSWEAAMYVPSRPLDPRIVDVDDTDEDRPIASNSRSFEPNDGGFNVLPPPAFDQGDIFLSSFTEPESRDSLPRPR